MLSFKIFHQNGFFNSNGRSMFPNTKSLVYKRLVFDIIFIIIRAPLRQSCGQCVHAAAMPPQSEGEGRSILNTADRGFHKLLTGIGGSRR